jgi:AraC-like DNA-binding protein
MMAPALGRWRHPLETRRPFRHPRCAAPRGAELRLQNAFNWCSPVTQSANRQLRRLGGQVLASGHPGWHHGITPAPPPAADQGRRLPSNGALCEIRTCPRRWRQERDRADAQQAVAPEVMGQTSDRSFSDMVIASHSHCEMDAAIAPPCLISQLNTRAYAAVTPHWMGWCSWRSRLSQRGGRRARWLSPLSQMPSRTAPFCPAWKGTKTTVARALTLIENGALDRGSVGQLAGRLGVGARHLSRLFAQHLDASPLQIAQSLRVQRAKRLLDPSDVPIALVAERSGFSSTRCMSNAFARL